MSCCRFQAKTSLLAYAPIKETGWRLGVVIPVAEISEPIQQVRGHMAETMRQTLILFLMATAITAAFAAALGSFLGYRTTKPIKRLILAIDAVGTRW